MSYRRRSIWDRSYTSVTKVSVHWSSKSSAYMVNFSDTHHWNEMQVLFNFIKGLDVSEKDCQCDESSGKKVWTWYFVEKYLEPFKALVESFGGQAGGIFEIDIIAKPIGGSNQSIFVPVDVYLDRFKTLTGQDIKSLDFNAAKKLYRKWLMLNHPDRKPENHIIVRDVNECWSNLELNHFKSKKEQEYVNA
jgi:hypothetical protein